MNSSPPQFGGPPDVTQLIQSALAEPPHAIAYHAGRALRDLWPGKAIIECSSCGFDLDGFVEAGHATFTYLTDRGHHQIVTSWRGCQENETGATCNTGEEGILRRPVNAFVCISWNGQSFDALHLGWREMMRAQEAFFLIGESEEIVEAFYRAVCAWSNVPHGEVLVFEKGAWRKDRELYDSIRKTGPDSLVLAPGLKEKLFDDVMGFFTRKDVYASHGVPWKRGILLLGPPGNGKTHAVKALCQNIGRPILYLRSIESGGIFETGQHGNISQVFYLARKTAPCLLVLEDLDALINSQNRSFFLNELDGFAQNTGICVLATTNYPERLDPSILDRPSRFDRKYTFELPSAGERRRYLEHWAGRQTSSLRLSPPGIDSVVAATEGFSFAYLQELCLAASMAWINAGPDAAIDPIALDQARQLDAQRMSSSGDPNREPKNPSRAEKIRQVLSEG